MYGKHLKHNSRGLKMKINTLNNIYFKSTNQSIVPRSQQQQQNKVKFEKECRLAEKADSIDANPITSLGYKLYRTFRFLSEKDTVPAQQTLNVAA